MNDDNCGMRWLTALQQALIGFAVGAAVTAAVLIAWAWKG